jgi:hypothetical protein
MCANLAAPSDSVFEKLGVNDRTAAVTVAIARGLLPTPGP